MVLREKEREPEKFGTTNEKRDFCARTHARICELLGARSAGVPVFSPIFHSKIGR